jgi:hypothetical protein
MHNKWLWFQFKFKFEPRHVFRPEGVYIFIEPMATTLHARWTYALRNLVKGCHFTYFTTASSISRTRADHQLAAIEHLPESFSTLPGILQCESNQNGRPPPASIMPVKHAWTYGRKATRHGRPPKQFVSVHVLL